jgi:hypothetical protein
MQDKVFETFQRLLKNQDPELMKILKADRESPIPVRLRQRSDNKLSLGPNVIQMVTVTRSFDSVRVDISTKLQRLLNDPNCNKGDVLKELSNDIGWQGMAQLFHHLLSVMEPADLIASDKQLELYSAGKPQYGIKVVPYGDYRNGKGGYFHVVMYDCADENIEASINFETQIQKVLYVWFLLHPRQKMTFDDFDKLIREKDAHLPELAKGLYKMGGNFAQKYLEPKDPLGREKLLKDFNSVKSNIASWIKKAWEEIGGRGILEWYTIQSEGKREANENSMSYFINLFPDNIKFPPCRISTYGRVTDTIDLEKCRMNQGTYPSIDDPSTE